MIKLQSGSLGARLMVPISCIVVAILVLVSIVLIWSERRAFNNISDNVAELAQQVRSTQHEAMTDIENKQVDTVEVSLVTKAESMANLVSGLAPTAILTFDFDILDRYCAALTRDPDIAEAYVTNNQGDVITSYRNAEDTALQKLIKDVSQLSIQEVVEQLSKDENTLQVQREIIQDGEILGYVNLIISREAANKQAMEIRSAFSSLAKITTDIFTSLQQGVQEQISSSTGSSAWQAAVTSLIGIIILTLGVALLLDKLVVKPVTDVMHMIGEMAKGHLGGRLNLDRSDEIGKMADSIDTLSNSLENEVLSALNKLADGDLTFEVKPKDDTDALGNALLKMSRSLNATIQQILDNASNLTNSSETLSGVATQLAAGSEEVSSQAANVAASTEQINVSSHDITITAEKMSLNMQKLAEVTNKIAEEVREIGGKARMGSSISTNALDTVTTANQTISSLQEAADEIGIATATIEEITEQTKLLALNATIEAARAGDAGKGFAVVAGEVKELAKQSADAADSITSLIKGVQDRTENAAKAINEVSGIITQLNESSNSISSAVDNHSRETDKMLTIVTDSKNGATEVTESILSLAKGANEVASNIQGVSSGMDDSTKGIRRISDSAEELANLANDLHELVNKFTLSIASMSDYETTPANDQES